MGKVILAESSGFLTISLVMTLQFRQTPAHATTFFLGGHVSSDASIRRRTSRRSSCGMLAQQLCLKPSPTTTSFSTTTTTLWDLDLMSSIMFLIIAIPRSPNGEKIELWKENYERDALIEGWKGKGEIVMIKGELSLIFLCERKRRMCEEECKREIRRRRRSQSQRETQRDKKVKVGRWCFKMVEST